MENSIKINRFANVFGNNPDISSDERNRVVSELQKIGSLTFKVEKHEDGWMATCIEVPGIIAGNTNPNPSDFEVESQVREAIYAAFNVKFEKMASPAKFEMNFGLVTA